MTYGIIGCGKMATALVNGAIQANLINPNDVLGFDPNADAIQQFTQSTGAASTAEMSDLSSCDVLLLCTKPQHAADALSSLTSFDGLLISIAAGLTLDWLEAHTPKTCRLIRCMPNTPALVQQGASAFSRGSKATDHDAETTQALLNAVGLAFELPESLLNAVTGLSGSGPAYAFLIIEALADGGERCGLPRDTSLALATQTILGAATMVAQTGSQPADLRDAVTSPGGTTIEALASLEKNGLRDALIAAVQAAKNRADELGKI